MIAKICIDDTKVVLDESEREKRISSKVTRKTIITYRTNDWRSFMDHLKWFVKTKWYKNNEKQIANETTNKRKAKKVSIEGSER